ncbi:MAG TPA: hypothetical protein VKV26_11475 [Dehalococcoidia bacterium]|nr:hypothetical protein [Dehalococcoidia bacterium]
MKRRILLLAVSAATGLALLGFYPAAPARAATLPAGWNLVAGADGATLNGASGLIYSLQPGDTTYQSFPAGSPLKAGWGYWAFFAGGGSVSSPSSRNGYSVTLTPGAWAMVGNPTSDCIVSVSGADSVLAYTPSGGYVEATSLGVGQGAWVMGAGNVTLTPGACVTATPAATPAAAAAPTPAPASASSGPDLTTITGLQSVALQQSDLPGYTSGNSQLNLRLSLRGGSVGYVGYWIDQNDRSPRLLVVDVLQTYPTPALAHQGFMAAAADALNPDYSGTTLTAGNVVNEGARGLGDEDAASYYLLTNSHGVQFDSYTEILRRGLTVAQVSTLDFTPTGSLLNPIAYAGIIYNRMQGR